MKNVLLAALVLCASEIAIGQEAASLPMDSLWAFLSGLAKPEFLAKIVAFMVAVQAMLRGMSEVLTRISDWLDASSPSKSSVQKAAAMASQASWFLGVFLGKFGYGEAKLVTQEKIDQASKPVAK